MSVEPGPWRSVDGRNPEREASKLRRRFARVTARYLRSVKRRERRWLVPFATIFAATFIIFVGLFALSPFSPVETLKHLGAFPNCNAARLMGLAPSNRGEPGYWASHDADQDGVACEPPPVVIRTNW